MVPPALPLLTSQDRLEARRLVESQGLACEDGCDEVVGIFEDGRLVATGARAGYVLKMFAIDAAHQGGDVLGQLATSLIESARRAGHESVFVYTRPQHASSFAACNFRLLVTTGDVALLEYGGGLAQYLKTIAARGRTSAKAAAGRSPEGAGAGLPRRSPEGANAGLPRRSPEGANAGLPRRSPEGANAGLPRRSPEGAKAGAIVLNGNPFTRGHLYLVETAAARVGTLYLFVVREDRSVFPFDARYGLARAATAHLANVVLLDTSRYSISAGTFPSYFLRRDDDAARLQMRVDACLFGEHIAPTLGIGCRFVGHEPYCPTTAAYNEALAEILPGYGVVLEVVARTGDDSGFFSATRVRAALAAGDLETVRRLVPPTTFEWLLSDAGRAVAERLRGRETDG